MLGNLLNNELLANIQYFGIKTTAFEKLIHLYFLLLLINYIAT